MVDINKIFVLIQVLGLKSNIYDLTNNCQVVDINKGSRMIASLTILVDRVQVSTWEPVGYKKLEHMWVNMTIEQAIVAINNCHSRWSVEPHED